MDALIEACHEIHPGHPDLQTMKPLSPTTQEDRENGGCSPSQWSPGSPSWKLEPTTSKDSLNKENQPDISIGKFWSTLKRRRRQRGLNDFSESTECTASSPILVPRPSTSGKKLPDNLVPSSSWESSQSEEMSQQTGTQSTSQQSEASSTTYQPKYEYAIVGISSSSIRSICSQFLNHVKLWYTGAQLVLENQEGPGMKLEFQLTLKTLCQNSGRDIEIRNMLSSMNLEETLQSPTRYGGSIATVSYWKLKAAQRRPSSLTFGSQATSIQESGIPTLTKQPMKPSKGD